MRAFICLFFMLFFAGLPCQSQDYIFKRRSLGVEDGLSSRSVNFFFFDYEGLVWMGTDFGLNRYDGHRVAVYNEANQRLLYNKIREISEDFQGNIWLRGDVADQGNIYVTQVLIKNRQTAVSLPDYVQTEIPFAQEDIFQVKSDPVSRLLWIVMKDGNLYTYGPDEAGKGHFVKQHEMGEIPYRSSAGAKGVWVQTPTRLLLAGPDGQLKASYEYTNGEILRLLGTDGKGNIINLRKSRELATTRDKGHAVFINNEPVYGDDTKFWNDKRMVGFDTYGHQGWYGHQGFRKVYNAQNQELIRFRSKTEFYAYPKFVHFDRAGNGWTSHDGQVNIMRIERSPFTNYLTEKSVFGMEGYGSRGIYVNDDNELFANGLGGSRKINLNTGEETFLAARNSFYRRGDIEELKRLAIIPDDDDGNLWLTDEEVRLIKFNPAKGSFTDYTYSPTLKRPKTPEGRNRDLQLHWSGIFDKNGQLWLGGRNGIRYLHPKDSVLVPFGGYGDFHELEDASIFHFFENEQGIWISSETGLYLMKEQQIVKRFHGNGNPGSYIPFSNVAHAREDTEGWFWLATKGGGLIRLNPASGEYKQYTIKEGLSDNVTYASYEDDFGYLWVPSNKGIMRIRLADFNVNTYLKADGLNHEEFNTTSHFQAKNGQLFFGGIDGITSFHPKDFVEAVTTERNLKVMQLQKQSRNTGLFVDQTPGFLQEGEINIDPSELGFSVGFTLLDYVNAPSNVFSYKIEGIDRQWNYIDEPLVRINALPYGSYQLVLRGQSSQGIWSREVSIPLNVLKPFYLQWWFFVSIGLVVGLSVYYWIKARIKRLETAKATLEKEVQARTETISAQAEELKKMDELKSRFFANVSHELRTPLTLILGPVSGLLDKEGLSDELRDDLQRIERNGRSMSNLVEEILDLSKLEANKLQVAEQPTIVKEYFSVVYSDFLSQARYRDMGYDFRYEGSDSLNVLLDQRIVARIVSNLLSNAFKFTPNEGQVALSVQESESLLCIKVSDSGAGISSEDLPHIFDRYFQTKDTSKPVEGGSGIGLAMSKELATLLGGKLSVESALKEGTTFTLTIPKKEVASEHPPTAPEASTAIKEQEEPLRPVDLGKAQLLIVEDNYDMQNYLLQVLKEFDGIAVANNGKQGLEKLNKDQLPDIIISDMMMPQMDGLEFLKKIRQQRATQDIPLLMLTARSAEEDKLEAFALGVDDYLLKPFSVEELKARLKNLLRNAEFRKEAQAASPQAAADGRSLKQEKEQVVDKALLKDIERLTRESVHRVDFNISSVANELGMSERQLQRKLKAATGYSPQVFVKEVRLQMARQYLETRNYQQVKDVAQAVGFSSSPYFSRLYKERFGKLPGAYYADQSKTEDWPQPS